MTALVLPPQTRAIGPVPAVAVSPGVDSVAFELQLESNDFPRYQVALADPPQIVSNGAAIPSRLHRPVWCHRFP